jgi:hypothetical protein
VPDTVGTPLVTYLGVKGLVYITILMNSKLKIGCLGFVIFAGAISSLCRAAVPTPAGVDTDPLNLVPEVRQAYERFYILDYDGALARFVQIQAENPDNPLAVDYVLDAVIFRELYRLDLLDTTFYAHDGFLTGKHPVAADPAVAGQVNTLYASAVRAATE